MSIKPVPFSDASPSVWFTILEAQFTVAGVTVDSTKFFHALAHLPVCVVSRISNDILQGNSYDELKDAVVSHFEASKPELFDQLLKEKALVGRPSDFLADIHKIAQKVGVTDDLIRHRFQQAMPSQLRPVLATQQALTLDQLGKLADEILPLCKPSNTVFEVNAVSTPAHGNNAPDTCPPRRPTASTSSNQHRGLMPFRSGQRQRVCRAHIFYGADARSCRPWCAWPDKSGAKVSATSSRSSSPAPLN